MYKKSLSFLVPKGLFLVFLFFSTSWRRPSPENFMPHSPSLCFVHTPSKPIGFLGHPQARFGACRSSLVLVYDVRGVFVPRHPPALFLISLFFVTHGVWWASDWLVFFSSHFFDNSCVPGGGAAVLYYVSIPWHCERRQWGSGMRRPDAGKASHIWIANCTDLG